MFIQQQPILYQIEMVPVPIIDLNKNVHSYNPLKVDRAYIAQNSENIYFIKTPGIKNMQKYWL